jgi:hypothetical protein
MKKTQIWRGLAVAVVLALGLSVHAGESEEKYKAQPNAIHLTDLPLAAQQALTREAHGTAIKRIVKGHETAAYGQIYIARLEGVGEGQGVLVVSAGGDILSKEEVEKAARNEHEAKLEAEQAAKAQAGQ